jgi:dienelactone hydrolase
MARVLRTALIASLLCALAACHRHSPTSVPTSAPGDPALSIAGDPESASGATWTLVGTLDGTTVDLQGVLLKPRGRGPFPAVVLSHGAGGNSQSYGRALGSVMRTWGLVGIAVNYTHASGAPLGAPGTLLEQGASPANAFRAHAAVTVLARLRYVDVRRVGAHGHSMGAFVTTAFVAAYPADVRVASHTSGGVLLDAIHREGIPVPSVAQARRIQAPYQWHHGLLDYAVPFLLDRRFDSVLTAPHEGHLYRHLRHAEVATDPEVLSRVRAWYTTHEMFSGPRDRRSRAHATPRRSRWRRRLRCYHVACLGSQTMGPS